MTAQPVHPLKIFYCYAHEDEDLRKHLERHLIPLRQRRDITGWFDLDIEAGLDWKRESEAHLYDANIILVLLSANFMASRYGETTAMMQAIERHRTGLAYVIPILLKPVNWEITPFGTLSPLPSNRRPVTSWKNREEALLDIAQGINKVIQTLLSRQVVFPEDKNMLFSPQGPLTGQLIGGKYLLGELLGQGGFGQVYKAWNLSLERIQAVKILLDRHFQKREVRERFIREARLVAALDHPNIIHVDDFDVEPTRAYLVMPFIEGGTLQDILAKPQNPLGSEQILFYLEHICNALDYAHTHGVVHLDLKPVNLLVRSNGSLLLADFGLAHLMKQGAVEGGISLLAGTPQYMAPEHIQGRGERRSDLFSLGVIVYQMVTGQLPFEGSKIEEIQHNIQTEQPVAIRTFRPELPPGIEDVMIKALAKQPTLRYQTGQELLDAFKEVLLGSNSFIAQPALPEDNVGRPKGMSSAQGASNAAEISLPFPPHGSPALTQTMPAGVGNNNQYATTVEAPAPPAFVVPPVAADTSKRPRQQILLRFFLLGLVGLVIAVLASGTLWLTNRQTSLIHTDGPVTASVVHHSPTATLYPSPTVTVPVSPAGIITEFSLSNNGHASFLVTGPDGNLWFVENHDDGKYHVTGHAITRRSSTGAITEFPLPNSQAGTGITAGPDGNLWFTEQKEDSNHHVTGSAIGRMSTTGAMTEFPLASNGGPHEITVGPDGNLWFIEYLLDSHFHTMGSKIGRITPAGAITEFPLPTSNDGPYGITSGPMGDLWFTEYRYDSQDHVIGSSIGRISPTGTITEFPLPIPSSGPFEITVGPDGNLWFTECEDDNQSNFVGKIGRMSPDGIFAEFSLPTSHSGSCPEAITRGPDGNLWFTEYGFTSDGKSTDGKIGRISPTGTITESPLPNAQSDPFWIVTGPDGNLWFSEGGSYKIGRITSGK